MLTLCWPKLAGMMAAFDETNWIPFLDRNDLLLSSRRTFDFSSFERLFMYSSNHSFPQTVQLAPDSNTADHHVSDSSTCESKSLLVGRMISWAM